MDNSSKLNLFLVTAGKIMALGMCIAGSMGPFFGALPASGTAGMTVASSNTIIPSGTKIAVRVNENIDGVEQKEGYRFPVYSVNEVRTDGTIVIPAGTPLYAVIAKNTGSADNGLSLYSVRLTDMELRGEKYRVVSDSRDIPVDPATNSPYPGRATNMIIPANTILIFTLTSPLAL